MTSGSRGSLGVIGREHPGAFQLEHEPGQGMGEYVVHLPGEPLAFGQSSRPCLRRPGALQFDQEPFGLVVGLPEPSCQQRHAREANNRDGAEQRQVGEPWLMATATAARHVMPTIANAIGKRSGTRGASSTRPAKSPARPGPSGCSPPAPPNWPGA